MFRALLSMPGVTFSTSQAGWSHHPPPAVIHRSGQYGDSTSQGFNIRQR